MYFLHQVEVNPECSIILHIKGNTVCLPWVSPHKIVGSRNQEYFINNYVVYILSKFAHSDCSAPGGKKTGQGVANWSPIREWFQTRWGGRGGGGGAIHSKPNFLEFGDQMAKMTLKVKVNDPYFHTSREYPRMHVCKFGDSCSKLWWVIMWAT